MDKALWFCVTLLAMAVIAESRPYECNRECAEKEYQRFRDDAQSFLNQISGIIDNVLNTAQDYINAIREQRRGGPQTVIIGPGHDNINKVVLAGGNPYQQ